ncbi:MAG: PAS domain S-box protein [Bacteroidales bacterium]|nr:PAS domain S-box protein [Bacteroidales bacterium]
MPHALLRCLPELNVKLAQAAIACTKNEALEESERRYRSLSEMLPEMICETDLEGNLTYANRFAIEKMGYTQEDILKGMNVFSMFPPQERVQAKENFLLSLYEDNLKPREYNIIKKDGETFAGAVYTKKIEQNGKVTGIRGVMLDITDRKNHEKELKQNSERLELALLGGDAGLWDWNIQTGSVYFSDRWCSMLGYGRNDIAPHVSSWEKLLHPEDKGMVNKALKQHLSGKTSLYRTEHRVKTKQGSYKWVLDTGRVTEWDQNGLPLRAVGTHIDVTWRKENEVLLEQNLQQQEILSKISLILNSLDDIDLKLNDALKDLCRFAHLSRAYMFVDDNEDNVSFNLFEWFDPEIIARNQSFSFIDYDKVPSLQKTIFTEGGVFCDNVKKLPEDLNQMLKDRNVLSIIMLPLFF